MTETWRKSTYSGGNANGECVEVRGRLDAIRDTKNRDVELLVSGLPMLVQQLQAGRFSLPTS